MPSSTSLKTVDTSWTGRSPNSCWKWKLCLHHKAYLYLISQRFKYKLFFYRTLFWLFCCPGSTESRISSKLWLRFGSISHIHNSRNTAYTSKYWKFKNFIVHSLKFTLKYFYFQSTVLLQVQYLIMYWFILWILTQICQTGQLLQPVLFSNKMVRKEQKRRKEIVKKKSTLEVNSQKDETPSSEARPKTLKELKVSQFT